MLGVHWDKYFSHLLRFGAGVCVLISPLLHAQTCIKMGLLVDGDDTEKPSRYFYANGRISNPISFGYEAELLVSQNPDLGKFYRPEDIAEADWARQPDRWQQEIRLRIEQADRHDVILVRREGTPKFLSPHAIKDTNDNDRIELPKNQVTEELSDVRDQFDWLNDNLKVATVHGHVAYTKDGTDMRGADVFAKMDADITQIETLARGYSRYKETLRVPAKNVVHWSTGLWDEKTQRVYRGLVEAENAPSGVPTLIKYTYGVALRGEVTYGPGKQGHEVRNAVKRTGVALDKMNELAKQAQDGFQAYRLQPLRNDPVLLSDETVRKRVATPTIAFYKELGDVLQGPEKSGGAPYWMRFAYPQLEWGQHPLVRVLPSKVRTDLQHKIDKATRRYDQRVEAISQLHLPPRQAIAQVQIAMATWAHETQLHVYLREGKIKLGLVERDE